MKKIINYLLVSLIILTLQSLPSLYPVYAAEEDTIENNKLTIHYYVQINGKDQPLQGADIELFRVADMKKLNGGVTYTLLPEYASAGETKDGEDITFEHLTVDRSVALAGRLDSIASTPDMDCTTDARGIADCGVQAEGMYLVRQKSASGKSSEYELFQPYLIAVPYPQMEDGRLTWIKEVVSEPKTRIKNTEESSQPTTDEESSQTQVSVDESRISPPESSVFFTEGSDTVGTGDAENLSAVYFCISAAAVLSIMFIVLSRRGKTHE